MLQATTSTPAADVRVSVSSLYASVDVDPDIHIPERRMTTGRFTRLLRRTLGRRRLAAA